MYYALSDRFSGDTPREYTHGFANTKEVIAFRSRKERDEWLKDTRLLTAKQLDYTDACRLSDVAFGYPNLDGYRRCVRLALSDEYIGIGRQS